MKLTKQIRFFLRYFFHPRLFIFILIGTGVIFLTFLTKDNALEIAISGIASVFIGIRVNNFSSLETHSKDEQKIKIKMERTLKVREITRSGINRINNGLNKESCSRMKEKLAELEQIIRISIEMMKEEDTLD